MSLNITATSVFVALFLFVTWVGFFSAGLAFAILHVSPSSTERQSARICHGGPHRRDHGSLVEL